MAKESSSNGNSWYAVKNICGALFFMLAAVIAGPLAGVVTVFALYILGIASIIHGLLSIGETGLVGTIIEVVIGVAIIAAAKWLMSWEIIDILIGCLMGVFIAIIGWMLRSKKHDRYAIGTESEKTMKTLATLLTAMIMGGGLLIAIGGIVAFIVPEVSFISIIGAIMCAVGMVVWIVYTVKVLKVLEKRGMTINDFKSGRSQNSQSSSSSSQPRQTQVSSAPSGANQAKVRSEMNSIASYYTGGWDYFTSKAKLTYRVSVSVTTGSIEFMVTATMSGTENIQQSEFELAKSKLQSVIEKKKQQIMDRAMSRLSAIEPDSDYNVRVGASVQ